LSVPALDAVGIRRRARDAVFELVDELLGGRQEATVGGALCAGLETEDAVRQAAYANRPESTAPSASE
jgi:hypothetical protein